MLKFDGAPEVYQINNSSSDHEKIHEFKGFKFFVKDQFNKIGNLSGRVSHWLNHSTTGHALKASAYAASFVAFSILTTFFIMKAASEVAIGVAAFTSGAGIPVTVLAVAMVVSDVIIVAGLFKASNYCLSNVLREIELAFDEKKSREV